MSTWQEEENTRRATLLATLAAIAEQLDGWHVETPHDHSARLVNVDGVTIWARVEGYGANSGRLSLSAGVPDGADYSSGDYHGLDRPEITVSPDRDPAALARDVARRLIPGAIDYWTAVSDRMAQRLEARNGREKLARELADIMGSEARPGRDDWQADYPRELPGYGEITPHHEGDEVRVELRSLPADRARELARLIASWRS